MEMPSTSFRVGIIGFGGIGEQHFLHLSRFQDVAVEVICDQDENRLRKAQQVCGMPRLATCAEEVFSLPLQAVVVATPNVTHYPLVKEALLRGWHVLCEKPFTMDVTQAEELCRLAGARELVHMVAFSYRFVPAVKMLREILERGQAGRIYHVRCHYLQSWLASPFAPYSWRLDVQQSGSGVLGDLGSHVFDLAEFLTEKNSSGYRRVPEPLFQSGKTRFRVRSEKSPLTMPWVYGEKWKKEFFSPPKCLVAPPAGVTLLPWK